VREKRKTHHLKELEEQCETLIPYDTVGYKVVIDLTGHAREKRQQVRNSQWGVFHLRIEPEYKVHYNRMRNSPSFENEFVSIKPNRR
jgi:hypothetical protein